MFLTWNSMALTYWLLGNQYTFMSFIWCLGQSDAHIDTHYYTHTLTHTHTLITMWQFQPREAICSLSRASFPPLQREHLHRAPWHLHSGGGTQQTSDCSVQVISSTILQQQRQYEPMVPCSERLRVNFIRRGESRQNHTFLVKCDLKKKKNSKRYYWKFSALFGNRMKTKYVGIFSLFCISPSPWHHLHKDWTESVPKWNLGVLQLCRWDNVTEISQSGQLGLYLPTMISSSRGCQ